MESDVGGGTEQRLLLQTLGNGTGGRRKQRVYRIVVAALVGLLLRFISRTQLFLHNTSYASELVKEGESRK